MIRSAFLLCAGIMVTACLACAQAPIPPAPPPPMVGPSAPVPSCTATDFARKISYFSDAAYHPDIGVGPPPSSPFPQGSPNYVQDLTAAFQLASPAVQQQLCNLDAVYINGSGTTCTSPEECFEGSWGWRQSKPTIGNGRVVALSTALWQEADYSHYETDLMQTILPLSGAYYSGAAYCSPQGGACTNVDTFQMAVLGALAHEVGHVLWYDVVSQYDPTTKTYSNPNNFCGGTFFPRSWAGWISPPPRWRHVLTPQQRQALWGNNWPNMHKNGPHIRDIDKSANKYDRANQVLGLLGSAEPWPSAFAAVSPDEDFVETYKFMVLTTAQPPLNSVQITIPTLPPSYVNIAADYAAGKKSDLAAKISCVQQALAKSR